MSEFRRRMLVQNSGGGLPYDAEVEYIESANVNQYINTGISGSSNVAFEIDVNFPGAASAAGWLFGSRVGNNNKMFAFMPYSKNRLSSFRYGNQSNSPTVSYINARYTLSNMAQHNVCIATGAISSQATKTYTCSAATFDNELPIYLYGMNDNGTAAATLVGIRFYGVKFWYNGELVRDFIPVRVGNVGYLYDKVSGKLYGNNGTGSFVIGNDVNI